MSVATYNIRNLIEGADAQSECKQQNRFMIPNYQRGYRWEPREVEKMLNDICQAKETGKTAYCLQPIVVQKIKTELREKQERRRIVTYQTTLWNVIDGQQRLTTLLLILYCLKVYLRGGAVYEVVFDSRDNSNVRLKEWIDEMMNSEEGEIPPMTFDANQDELDVYYMSQAVETIACWLEDRERGNFIKEYNDYLRECVLVLWYEFQEDDGDPIDLFTRINMGKIPLTVSELLKAMILRLDTVKIHHETEEQCRDIYEDDFNAKKRIHQQIENTHKSERIQKATKWDLIEQDLSEDAFFRFLCADATDRFENRLDYYFLLLYKLDNPGDSKEDRDTLFDHFEKEVLKADGAARIWERLWKLHITLSEWYRTSETFHKIGYLVTDPGSKSVTSASVVKNLYNAYTHADSKADFLKTLDKNIAARLDKVFEKVTFEELNYNDHDLKILSVLLLFNVHSAMESPNYRFSFDKIYPLKDGATLEHIFPQNPYLDCEKKDPAEFKQFIDEVEAEILRIGGDVSQLPALDLERMKAGRADEQAIAAWWKKAMELLGLGEDSETAQSAIQQIGNMALISRNINAGLTNKMFYNKQRMIKNYDCDDTYYIPLCTHNAFLKYYSISEDSDMSASMIWTCEDMKRHAAEIRRVVDVYRTNKGGVNDGADK